MRRMERHFESARKITRRAKRESNGVPCCPLKSRRNVLKCKSEISRGCYRYFFACSRRSRGAGEERQQDNQFMMTRVFTIRPFQGWLTVKHNRAGGQILADSGCCLRCARCRPRPLSARCASYYSLPPIKKESVRSKSRHDDRWGDESPLLGSRIPP
jgi:hypothetical protein